MSLKNKIEVSNNLISETFSSFNDREVMIAWTGGKDSTVLLHLIRQMYSGEIPCRVYFNDSGMEFPEVIDFIDAIEKEWGLDLVRHPHSDKDQETLSKSPDAVIAREAKVRSIVRAIDDFGVRAFLSGIRADEHLSRADSSMIVQYKDHTRYHPILNFTEDDVWEYIKRYKVPYVSLYDKGYRSLGEKPFTNPATVGDDERSGRDQDKEKLMQRLRNLGYW